MWICHLVAYIGVFISPSWRSFFDCGLLLSQRRAYPRENGFCAPPIQWAICLGIAMAPRRRLCDGGGWHEEEGGEWDTENGAGYIRDAEPWLAYETPASPTCHSNPLGDFASRLGLTFCSLSYLNSKINPSVKKTSKQPLSAGGLLAGGWVFGTSTKSNLPWNCSCVGGINHRWFSIAVRRLSKLAMIKA